jgi:hypothetical protein
MPKNWHGQPAYLPPGDPEQMSEASLHAPGQLGMRFTIKQPAGSGTPGLEEFRFKTYQIVKTDSSMTVSPFKGAVAWWSDKTGYVVTTSPTALGRGRVAGVFQNLAAYPFTKGHYCCIQVKGPGITKFVDAPTAAPTAAGLFVIPSATAGKADCLAAGSAATYPPLGVSAGVYDATNTEGIVDLDVPDTV